jgi:hypothetical protein
MSARASIGTRGLCWPPPCDDLLAFAAPRLRPVGRPNPSGGRQTAAFDPFADQSRGRVGSRRKPTVSSRSAAGSFEDRCRVQLCSWREPAGCRIRGWGPTGHFPGGSREKRLCPKARQIEQLHSVTSEAYHWVAAFGKGIRSMTDKYEALWAGEPCCVSAAQLSTSLRHALGTGDHDLVEKDRAGYGPSA